MRASPVKQNSTTTKALILIAARRRFSHYGFSKVTMDEIAGELGMGKASLYYYYRTKESLFQAVIVHEHGTFIKSISALLREDMPASEKLRAYVEQRFEYFNTLMNLNILDLNSSVKAKPMLRATFDAFSRHELRLVRKIIQEGNTGGEFGVGAIDKVAQAILHIMQGLRCRFVRTMKGPVVDAKQYEHLRQEMCFVLEIFLRGIRR